MSAPPPVPNRPPPIPPRTPKSPTASSGAPSSNPPPPPPQAFAVSSSGSNNDAKDPSVESKECTLFLPITSAISVVFVNPSNDGSCASLFILHSSFWVL